LPRHGLPEKTSRAVNRESIRSTWTLVLTAGLILGPRAGNALSLDDFQLRPAIPVEEWARGPLALLGWAELRSTVDVARFTNWRIGQRLQYNPWRELTVAASATLSSARMVWTRSPEPT
jgi:hypothetical protein